MNIYANITFQSIPQGYHRPVWPVPKEPWPPGEHVRRRRHIVERPPGLGPILICTFQIAVHNVAEPESYKGNSRPVRVRIRGD